MMDEDDKDPALMAHRIATLEREVAEIKASASKIVLAVLLAAAALVWEPLKAIIYGARG